VLLGWWLGIDPSVLIGAGDVLTGGGRSQQQTQNAPDQTASGCGRRVRPDPRRWYPPCSEAPRWYGGKCFKESGKQYEPPTLVMFFRSHALGLRILLNPAMGPFYCPARSQGLSRYGRSFGTLSADFHGCDAGSKACQFSQAYVNHPRGRPSRAELAGILPKVQRMAAEPGQDRSQPAPGTRGAGRPIASPVVGPITPSRNGSHRAWRTWKQQLQTASADRRRPGCSAKARAMSCPDAFTHGSSAQRTRWFMNGLKSGKVEKGLADNVQLGKVYKRPEQSLSLRANAGWLERRVHRARRDR